jgi:hypothetical protein
MAVFIAASAFFFITVSTAHEAGPDKFTKHFNESLFKITEKGEFSVEILLDEKEYKIGRDVVGIVIHNKHDEDVEGALVSVTIKTPDNTIESPSVKEDRGGLYLMSAKGFKRGDKFELKIIIKKKKIEDSAVFIFPDSIKDRLPKGKN